MESNLTTTARYLAPLPEGTTPYTYAYKPKEDNVRLVLYPLRNHVVPIDPIREAWGTQPAKGLESNGVPSLNEDGIQLVLGDRDIGKGLSNAARDFDDDGKVEAVYYPQVAEFLRKLIEQDGKRKVKKTVIFDHTLRRRRGLNASIKGNSATGVSVNPKEREPVGSCHGDYTIKSGPQRVRDLVGGAEAEQLLKENNWAIVNVWKPLKGPICDAPLAFVAPGTCKPADDFLPHKLIYADRVGETLAVKHNPAHRFIYCPLMDASDVWAFKTYDSKTGVAKVMPHTGIEEPDPKVKAMQNPNEAGRESIEVRMLVFWDDVKDGQSKL